MCLLPLCGSDTTHKGYRRPYGPSHEVTIVSLPIGEAVPVMSGDADWERCHFPMYETGSPPLLAATRSWGSSIELGVLRLDDVVEDSVAGQVAAREEARPAR